MMEKNIQNSRIKKIKLITLSICGFLVFAIIWVLSVANVSAHPGFDITFLPSSTIVSTQTEVPTGLWATMIPQHNICLAATGTRNPIMPGVTMPTSIFPTVPSHHMVVTGGSTGDETDTAVAEYNQTSTAMVLTATYEPPTSTPYIFPKKFVSVTVGVTNGGFIGDINCMTDGGEVDNSYRLWSEDNGASWPSGVITDTFSATSKIDCSIMANVYGRLVIRSNVDYVPVHVWREYNQTNMSDWVWYGAVAGVMQDYWDTTDASGAMNVDSPNMVPASRMISYFFTGQDYDPYYDSPTPMATNTVVGTPSPTACVTPGLPGGDNLNNPVVWFSPPTFNYAACITILPGVHIPLPPLLGLPDAIEVAAFGICPIFVNLNAQIFGVSASTLIGMLMGLLFVFGVINEFRS